jgi:hypothetical protein
MDGLKGMWLNPSSSIKNPHGSRRWVWNVKESRPAKVVRLGACPSSAGLCSFADLGWAQLALGLF